MSHRQIVHLFVLSKGDGISMMVTGAKLPYKRHGADPLDKRRTHKRDEITRKCRRDPFIEIE
jgi:hypothetical protein